MLKKKIEAIALMEHSIRKFSEIAGYLKLWAGGLLRELNFR